MRVCPSPTFCSSVLALLGLACAGNPSPGGPGTYRGVVVGSSQIGTLDVTVAGAASPFPASGTLSLPDRVVSLAGTLDQSKRALSLSSADGYQLAALSRVGYAYGSYAGPGGAQDRGSFALLLAPPDGTPVQLFCGGFVASTTDTSLPFAVTAVPPGNAICVGPNLTWFGTLDVDGSLYCSVGGGEFDGNVNNLSTSTPNQWGTGQNSGTWAVAPCTGNAGDGGVDDAGGAADSATTPAGGSASDGGVDASASSATDADT